MGSGDVKIGIILGLLTGYPVVFVAMFSAFVFGSIVGLGIVFWKNKSVTRESLKVSMPFAPFLIMGILFSLLYGQAALDWYSNLFITF